MPMGVPSVAVRSLAALLGAVLPAFSNPIHPDPSRGRLPASLAGAGDPIDAFYWDLKDMNARVQRSLMQGQYRAARERAQRWLTTYAEGLEPDTRYDLDAKTIRRLCRHLVKLERRYGPEGKSIYTSDVPESMRQWSRRHEVPVVFFKLVPYQTGGAFNETVLPGRLDAEPVFRQRIEELNHGFDYVSGGQFSLELKQLDTLYVRPGDLDPTQSGGDILTSRVYVHTLPSVYQWVGEAFIVLVDYRESSTGEASYMGDGIIHVSASKLQPLTLMHEILHGLGAVHQVNSGATADRGLMTFEKGEILELGLDEKNRLLLGWPRVSVVKVTPQMPHEPSAVPQMANEPSTPAFVFPSL